MAYEPQPNSGTLWREPKEKISQKTGQPYKFYSGDCVIDGKDYWINGFLNTVKTKDGDKELYRLSFRLKEQRRPEQSQEGF